MTGELATGTDFGIGGRPLPEHEVRALDFRFWPRLCENSLKHFAVKIQRS
jgi:hypothetical protein